MARSDIRIRDMKIAFSDEKFRTPLKLSTGDISEITYASVQITVENSSGHSAKGVGGILLSDLWAFPTPFLSHEQKDQIMREMVTKIGTHLLNIGGYYDPLQISNLMEHDLNKLLHEVCAESKLMLEIPKLVGLVCWSPFDAALHDGWGKAWNRSSFEMYTRDCLNYDLGHYLGTGWSGKFPDDFLAKPRKSIMVQHAVGASDLLTPPVEIRQYAQNDGLPVSLTEWIARDSVRWFKLKLRGTDIPWDLQRILDVYRVASESLMALGVKEPPCLAVDPNEACAGPEPVIELLRKLHEADISVYDALMYIEQPTPRQLADYDFTLHEISKYKPVLIDESLEDLGNLRLMSRLGWNGVALKTCKGQSHALITYCYAKANGLFTTVQDLTNPGFSFVHSANLCSHLSLSCAAIEYNSRQYAPFSRKEEQRTYPDLFRVRDGQIDLTQIVHLGLY